MKKKWTIMATIIAIIFTAILITGPIISNVEKPDYQVISSDGKIEIRHYPAMIIAKVQVDGTREDAISNAFPMLADYIFGNNQVASKIAMTAPVQQQKSSKIAMTAPVQQQMLNDSWQISFIMPTKYNLENLPKPMNKNIELQEVPAKQFVVIRFSGTSSEKNVAKNEKELREYIKNNDLKTQERPKYAFYNAPITLPPMRRNEIMFELN